MCETHYSRKVDNCDYCVVETLRTEVLRYKKESTLKCTAIGNESAHLLTFFILVGMEFIPSYIYRDDSQYRQLLMMNWTVKPKSAYKGCPIEEACRVAY